MTAAPIYPLRATYRLQINEEFDLRAAAAQTEHIAGIGASHIYLSPIFEARSGSTHGYDVTDPTRVRAAIGGEAAFAEFVTAARRHGLGLLLDIVPNHMAASEENGWLRDVLEFGSRSPYQAHFDLSWRADADDPRLTLPVLGNPPEHVVAAGEIVLDFDGEGLAFSYFGRRFPVRPPLYTKVLGMLGPADERRLDNDNIAQQARALLAQAPPAAGSADAREERAWKAQLLHIAAETPRLRAVLSERAAAYAGSGRDAQQRMLRLLDEQHYRLVFWKDVDSLLGYRRFFDITDLIGVRVEAPHVFHDTHRRVLDWIADDTITGVRIDHIDGLLDPTGYVLRLRHECTGRQPERPVPILVEKILAHDEPLPAEWPVDGTTGYEFLNTLNGLFVDGAGLARLTDTYQRDTGIHDSFADIVYEKKKYVLANLFAGEWRVLVRELAALTGESSVDDEAALREITACLRVYRTYAREGEAISSGDDARIRAAAEEAEQRGHARSDALRRVSATLRLDAGSYATDAAAALAFVCRWQQLTGPAMAKGLEDTALYTFLPLASVNDVGGEADHAVRSPDSLHAFLAARAEQMPDTLNATSTHDTKRSEDVRARINVLSELPDEWLEHWQRWRSLNAVWRERADAPTVNEEYLLYQSIVGAWPGDELSRTDFVGRMQRYMEKALREAKASTSWLKPQESHERAVASFTQRILDPRANPEFVRDVAAFVARIAPAGVLNALAQTAIKAWAPGVPDFYQGSESWAFDLVDPDNRRPVDYRLRGAAVEAASAQLHDPAPSRPAEWLGSWQDGRIKTLVTVAALHGRAAVPAVFALGKYHPLRFAVTDAERWFGFAREHENVWRVLVAPRMRARPGPGDDGNGARVQLPTGAPVHWCNLLNGRRAVAAADGIELDSLLAGLPLALLVPA